MKETQIIDKETLLKIGSRCYELRVKYKKERLLSQREFARVLGIAHSAISQIESGLKDMTIKELVAYKEKCKVSYDYLLGEADCKEVENQKINLVTGLSEEAIEKLKVMKRSNISYISNRIISHIQFLATVNKINDLVMLKLEDGYHAIVPNGDFKALCDGKKGKANLVDKSIIKDLYISKSVDYMKDTIKDVVDEITNDTKITATINERVMQL